MCQMIKKTSIRAYNEPLATGAINKQHHKILCAMARRNSRFGYTRQQLVKKTGMPINVITPRVRELLDLKKLQIIGTKKFPITTKNVEALQLL